MKAANKVVFLQNKKIIEEGSYYDLVENKAGFYHVVEDILVQFNI